MDFEGAKVGALIQFQANEKKTSQTLVTKRGHALHLHPFKTESFRPLGFT
jgi:hypothetical protein